MPQVHKNKVVKKACNLICTLYLKCCIWFHTSWMQLWQTEVGTCTTTGILNTSLWHRNVKSLSQRCCNNAFNTFFEQFSNKLFLDASEKELLKISGK